MIYIFLARRSPVNSFKNWLDHAVVLSTSSVNRPLLLHLLSTNKFTRRKTVQSLLGYIEHSFAPESLTIVSPRLDLLAQHKDCQRQQLDFVTLSFVDRNNCASKI